jgi:hypothetical protein
MIGRFVVVQPVPPAFFADTELMYSCLRPMWENEVAEQFGEPVIGPLFYKRLTVALGAAFITEWMRAGYIPIMIHGPAYTATPPLNAYARRKR